MLTAASFLKVIGPLPKTIEEAKLASCIKPTVNHMILVQLKKRETAYISCHNIFAGTYKRGGNEVAPCPKVSTPAPLGASPHHFSPCNDFVAHRSFHPLLRPPNSSTSSWNNATEKEKANMFYSVESTHCVFCCSLTNINLETKIVILLLGVCFSSYKCYRNKLRVVS